MSHTPGPWTVETGAEYGYFYIDEIADALIKDDYKSLFEANARLIAAAPDLLEALERIESGEERPREIAWATLKIAKARP